MNSHVLGFNWKIYYFNLGILGFNNWGRDAQIGRNVKIMCNSLDNILLQIPDDLLDIQGTPWSTSGV